MSYPGYPPYHYASPYSNQLDFPPPPQDSYPPGSSAYPPAAFPPYTASAPLSPDPSLGVAGMGYGMDMGFTPVPPYDPLGLNMMTPFTLAGPPPPSYGIEQPNNYLEFPAPSFPSPSASYEPQFSGAPPATAPYSPLPPSIPQQQQQQQYQQTLPQPTDLKQEAVAAYSSQPSWDHQQGSPLSVFTLSIFLMSIIKLSDIS